MIRTVVILVNYNVIDDTMECIRSLKKLVDPPKIIVVDNASSEYGVERIPDYYPDVKVIYSETNIGFGRGNNLGIKWALKNTQCKFIFILNNDTIVESNTLPVLEKTMDNHPNTGIVAPKIVMMDNPDLLWYGGGEVDCIKGCAKIPGFMGSSNTNLSNTSRYVDFASGCAMLVRRKVFTQLGGFDPRFFMYEEDIDFCLRVLSSGWKIKYVSESIVNHKAQGSQRSSDDKYIRVHDIRNPYLPFFMYHFTKNRLLTMSNHAKGINAVVFWLMFPVYWFLKSVKHLLFGRWDVVTATFRGLQDYHKTKKKPFINELD